jgi:AcrR family transcriptional regulator
MTPDAIPTFSAHDPVARLSSPRPRGGRPSRDDSQLLRDRLLDVATELLLVQGYGSTSIEAIVSRAGVSKRTFYHRFEDKQALMAAVVARLVDQLRPPPGVPLVEGGSLDVVLRNLGGLILHAALTPKALALHRLIVAEAQRFPELAQAVAQSGGRREAVGLIVQVLQRYGAAGTLDAAQLAFAAQQFLQMVVSHPQMRALGIGDPMTPGELDDWLRRSVALFVGGYVQIASSGR